MFDSFAVLFLLISLKPFTGYMSFNFLFFLQSYKAYCSFTIYLRWLTGVLDMFCAAVHLQHPGSVCLSQGQRGKKENQKHKIINTNTKVQSMQINWLANKYNLSTFSFHPPTPINISRFKQKDKLCGGQFSFEIATSQICPKHYKNIQSVRLVEMLRLVSSIR